MKTAAQPQPGGSCRTRAGGLAWLALLALAVLALRLLAGG